MRHRTRVAAGVLCAAVLLLTSCAQGETTPADQRTLAPPTTVAAPPKAAGPYPVVKVVDGDTLWVVRDGQRVKLRLIGIDTPETHDPRKPVQCFGPEAAAAGETMLTGQTVSLETDPTQAGVDKYGRELVYVWLGGNLVNLEMIRGGFAHEYTYDRPYRYQQQFKKAERTAAASGAGLWAASTCGGDTTQAAR